MKRTAAAAALLLFLLFLLSLLFPVPARAEEESLEAVENDLASLLKEMDAMSSELDRIRETVAVPRSTTLRVEIHREGDPPAPVAGRILVQGNVEDEREWSKAEREAFTGGSPLVFQVPFLPGTYAARFEIAHPAWKTPPAADFRASLGKGETYLLRLRLSVPPGKTDPILLPMTEK